MIGQLLGGRYQILNVLGAGNFGQTYLAEDRHRPDNTKCVVKHLKPASADQSFLPTARELFKREAQTLERLGHHPQIPRLLAYFEQDQEFYLVQDYIAGQVLRSEFLPRGIWPDAKVLQLLQDTLGILEFVHGCGVIHRDLKPDNLIRRQADQRLVLIDFGAVKQMRASIVSGNLINDQVGSTIAIGTPGYMPPEQAQGRPRPCSDLYALGMMGIQALTGKLPSQLREDTQGKLLWQEEAPQVNDHLAMVINRLIRPQFKERYQSAAEVLEALQQSNGGNFFQRVGRFLRPAGGMPAANGGRNDATVINTQVTPVPPTGVLPGVIQNMPGGKPASAVNPIPVTETPQTGRVLAGKSEQPFRLPDKPARIFISYTQQEPDLSLAQQFFQALQRAGHSPFLSGQSGQLGPGWAQQVDAELKHCDYFLLLLSPESALSEVILAEVRAAKQRQDQALTQPPHPGVYKPVILPIRVNLPMNAPLNYELRGHLHRLQQRFWHGPADTTALVQDVLNLLASSDPELTTSSLPTAGSGSIPTMPPVVVDPNAPPVPVAEPELPEGQVDLASSFYIERSPIEARCLETILQPGALIRIKAPRQMGKTSLMARTLYRAGEAGYRTVPLSLQLADAKVFTDLDKILRWLCASVGRRLGLPNKVKEYWDEIFGSKYNCTAYFEEYLLPEIQQPLVLGLDEVDRVFEYPEVASDFFGLLRAWHEEAKNRDIWKNLRLVVVHATEVYIPLNTNQSPFNVGLPIELPEFNADQVAELARRHGLTWSSGQIQDLMTMIGGHPYLVRLSLYHIARQDLTLQQLLANAATETGLFRDHLRGQWWHLQHYLELANAFKQVLLSPSSLRLDTMDMFKLHSLGLIRLEGNEAKLRCQLYRQYFTDILTAAQPES
jgi:AAA-like domain/Protein kinase domain/TIR domain